MNNAEESNESPHFDTQGSPSVATEQQSTPSYVGGPSERVAHSSSSTETAGARDGDPPTKQAQHLKDTTTSAVAQTARTAEEQAQNVTDDVRAQVKNLAGETKTQLADQASTQRDRAVDGLHSLGNQLQDMSQQSEGPAFVGQLASEGAEWTHRTANYLADHEPRQLLDELRGVARRKPGTFLIGAAAAGVVVGRLTRGAMAANSKSSSGSGPSSSDETAMTTPTSPAVSPTQPEPLEPTVGRQGAL